MNERLRYLTIQKRKKIQDYCNTNNKQDLLAYIEFVIKTGLRRGEN